MKCAGYSLQDIVHIIGHKNLETLKYYLEKPTLKDKENYADDLFAFTGSDDNESDLSDFKVPQPSKPNPKKQKIKHKPTATVTKQNYKQNKTNDKTNEYPTNKEIVPRPNLDINL